MQASEKQFSLIVAMAKNRGIGLNGGFPWPMIKKDLKHFSQVTQTKQFGLSMAEMARERVFYQGSIGQSLN